jgi:hypothetical protein
LEHPATQTDVEERQNERLLDGTTEVLRPVAAVEQQILGLEQRNLQLEQSILTGITTRPADPRTWIE